VCSSQFEAKYNKAEELVKAGGMLFGVLLV
jgi:hypothetical protein